MTDITHESHFAWQAQYLVTLEGSPVAARIVNDVSYATDINHESHFAWQAQIFGDLGVSLFVGGAAFGDVGVSLFVAGAVFGEIWVDSWSVKCCNFQ